MVTNEEAAKCIEHIRFYMIGGECWTDADFKAMDMAIEALQSAPSTSMSNLIDRQAAIDALWKALYEYEDKTEKQFQESEDLDLKDWILHRIFVQNMNDIDRQTILNLPSAQPEPCEDAVSRKAVQYLLAHFVNEDKYNDACEGLKHLPSVTPKQPEPCEDAVSREAVSEWLKQYGQDVLHGKYKFSLMYIWKNLMDLPSAQSEPSIPISWIEEQIKRIKSMDNAFAKLTAMNIETLLKRWQDESD